MNLDRRTLLIGGGAGIGLVVAFGRKQRRLVDQRADLRDHDLRDDSRGEGRADQVRPGGKTIVL